MSLFVLLWVFLVVFQALNSSRYLLPKQQPHLLEDTVDHFLMDLPHSLASKRPSPLSHPLIIQHQPPADIPVQQLGTFARRLGRPVMFELPHFLGSFRQTSHAPPQAIPARRLGWLPAQYPLHHLASNRSNAQFCLPFSLPTPDSHQTDILLKDQVCHLPTDHPHSLASKRRNPQLFLPL